MSKLDDLIRETAEAKSRSAYELYRKSPEIVSEHIHGVDCPETLDRIPDEALADWARQFIRRLTRNAEQSQIVARAPGEQPEIKPPKENLRILGSLLMVVGAELKAAPPSKDFRHDLSTLSSHYSLQGMKLWIASLTGYSPELRIFPEGIQFKALSRSFHQMKSRAIGSMVLLEADGQSRLSAAKRVSKWLGRANVQASADTIRKDWLSEIETEESKHSLNEDRVKEIPFRAHLLILDSWLDFEALLSWGEHTRFAKSCGQPTRSFAEHAVSLKSKFVDSYLEAELSKRASDWIAEREEIGEKRR